MPMQTPLAAGDTSWARPVTRGPHLHLFGYYGVRAVDRSGSAHLALRVPFHDRVPGATDAAEVGLIDLGTGRFAPLARTCAWNLQQGSMASWVDDQGHELLAYNDWEDGRTVARLVEPRDGGRVRTLQRAIACVSEDGRAAWGRDYARSWSCRAVTGYAPLDPPRLVPRPADDGIWRLDLATGRADLILSVAAIAAAAPIPLPDDAPAWFDHVHANPSGTRLLILFRIRADKGWRSSLWTCDGDGRDLHQLIGYEARVSHFAWIDDQRLLLTTDAAGPMGFVTMRDKEARPTPFMPGRLPADGHPAYSPDRRWLVTDAYPTADEPSSPLILVDVARERRIDIGRLASPRPYRGDIRCDLHPRWLPDGSGFTIDSIHAGDRQIYRVDLADLADASSHPG